MFFVFFLSPSPKRHTHLLQMGRSPSFSPDTKSTIGPKGDAVVSFWAGCSRCGSMGTLGVLERWEMVPDVEQVGSERL